MTLSRARKRILVFVDWYEPGFKGGGPIRSIVNFAQHMREDFEVFVFTGDRDLGDSTSYEGIPVDAWIKRGTVNVFYASAASLKWKKILDEITFINPSCIYLNSMYALYFTIYPLLMKRMGKFNAKIVLAPRGMLQQGALQFKNKKKKLFLNAINVLGIVKNITAHATDEQESRDIKKHIKAASEIAIIPNFSSALREMPVNILKDPGKLKVVFISRISRKKNLLFFLLLLTRLPMSVKLHFTIRGNIEEQDYWNECNTVLQNLPANITAHYDGPIDHLEVAFLIQQHHIFVLPTLGENFGHAIFESLAEGRPVLISDQTPWRNLAEYKAGWDLPLQNEAQFVRILEEVTYMNNEAFQQWSKGAWQFAHDYLQNIDLRNRYIDLFN